MHISFLLKIQSHENDRLYSILAGSLRGQGDGGQKRGGQREAEAGAQRAQETEQREQSCTAQRSII